MSLVNCWQRSCDWLVRYRAKVVTTTFAPLKTYTENEPRGFATLRETNATSATLSMKMRLIYVVTYKSL
jgi:hypothetical protein